MRKIRYVLFDFDGVIADTEASNSEYFCNALKHFGVYLTPQEQHSLIGTNNSDRVAQFLARASLPVSVQELREYRKTLGNTYEDGHLEAMPGLIPLLNRLKAQGVGIALVSSTSSHLIETGLHRLGLTSHFDVVICGDMVQNRKPHPEPYRKAIQHFDADPHECLVIEDSPVGIQAGKAAGCLVAGFCGAQIKQDISLADFRLDSFYEFYSLPVSFL